MPQPQLRLTGTNIDAPDASALADFYRRLLGWKTDTDEPGWVVLRAPGALRPHLLRLQLLLPRLRRRSICASRA